MLYVSHATHEASRLLSELLVNYPMDENGRSAFARAFRLRVEEGGFELLLNDISRYAREANIEGGISIAEVDLNPSVPALVEASIERLLTVIPVGKVLVEGSWELAEFEARVREELAYHWRRRLEGVDMAIAARRAGEGDRDGHCHPKKPARNEATRRGE
jgi:hypothetical protein